MINVYAYICVVASFNGKTSKPHWPRYLNKDMEWYRTLLLPYLIGGNHFVLFYLVKDTRMVYIYDPFLDKNVYRQESRRVANLIIR